MCYLLRHNPSKGKLTLDKYGYVNIDKLAESLSKLTHDNVTTTDIKEIIHNDPKGRYTLNNHNVKCNFGHSIPIELETPTSNIIPNTLYHGTDIENLESIIANGLVSKQRQYVHLTTDLSVATQVGLRYAKDNKKLIILTIDSKQMITDGCEILATDTSTYLTHTVNPKYIKY